MDPKCHSRRKQVAGWDAFIESLRRAPETKDNKCYNEKCIWGMRGVCIMPGCTENKSKNTGGEKL